MLKLNRTRMDFLEEFQKMIDEFVKKLSEEDKCGLAEQLIDEELVIFDLLTKPDIHLTKSEPPR